MSNHNLVSTYGVDNIYFVTDTFADTGDYTLTVVDLVNYFIDYDLPERDNILLNKVLFESLMTLGLDIEGRNLTSRIIDIINTEKHYILTDIISSENIDFIKSKSVNNLDHLIYILLDGLDVDGYNIIVNWRSDTIATIATVI